MFRKLLTLVLFAAVTAAAQPAPVQFGDFRASLDLIAAHLALELILPEGGIEAFWPPEVDEVDKLPPVKAEVREPEVFNNEIGEGADLRPGDIVILTPAKGGSKWRAAFYYRNEGSWMNPELTVDTPEFFKACDEAGVNIRDRSRPVLEGTSLIGTVKKLEAFVKAFAYVGEAAKDQTVILRPGHDGSSAILVRPADLGTSAFEIAEGRLLKVE